MRFSLMRVFICPICGEEVPVKAKACPQCGSDEKTGWSENTYLDGIDLYGEDEYQETIRKEFGESKLWTNKKQFFISIIAAIFLFIFIMTYVCSSL
jgi:uncharacterized membrane protein YvbJ